MEVEVWPGRGWGAAGRDAVTHVMMKRIGPMK